MREFKIGDSVLISTDLVVVYVIEILKCHFCGNMVENVLTKSI